jgi:hypothetical protein
MTLMEWKRLCEEFRARGDQDGLRAIGGKATGAHRYRVKAALEQGKPVPPEVLTDYPDLVQSGNG